MNIGVFDSGVGGLWILKHLKESLPHNNYIFFGDQGHIPYGGRQLKEIKDFSEEITNFLVGKNCQIVVIACNTASAASLTYLREKFPHILFVGMEPAVKPAVENTETGRVGVLATPATFQGELYNSVVERFAHNVKIFKNTCPGLVEQIEKGETNSNETKIILEKALLPMIEEGVDTIVLGCTHYPFVLPLIKEIVGEEIKVIDPTSAIVKRVETLSKDLENQNKIFSHTDGHIEIFTSGNLNSMKNILTKLFNNETEVKKASWSSGLKIMI